MEQAHALAILKSGQNVFLTGSAGTGKTYVLNQYVKYLKDRKVPVAVTASTGIAATHLNGMTIHAWSGIGVKDTLSTKDLDNMKSKKYLQKQLNDSRVLIIDEISMLHQRQFEMVNRVLQYFKGNQEPFGGIQVIVSGDFFQLPPVGIPGETNKDKFAFMSPAWVNAGFSVCYLTEQYRQSDNELNDILNEIRQREVSLSSLEKLNNAANTVLPDGWEPTKLYSHNSDVDYENRKHLVDLPGAAKTFNATTKGNAKLIESLISSVLAEEKLQLKPGAKVMFVKNNQDWNYNNGTLGEVIGYNDEGYPEVKTLDGRIIVAEEEEWSMDNDQGKSLAKFIQVPLRLAWAITIHKSQGVTLEAAEMDLTKTFEMGQGYVALSRLKELKYLLLRGYNDTTLEVDSLAYKADKRFQELSEEQESIIDTPGLERKAKDFLRRSGGLVTDAEIEKHKKKLKHKKGPKKSTYEITKEYIEQGLTLEQIANERGMTLGTVMGHLVRVKSDFPDVSIEKYKPSDEVLNMVETTYRSLLTKNQIKEDGTVSQKAMFEGMNGKVGYNEIKLAMAFIEL